MNTILTDDERRELVRSEYSESEASGYEIEEFTRKVEAAVLAKLREQEPQDRERWLAVREGHFNAASAEYFNARQHLDTPENRRIFYAGHCKGYDAAPLPAVVQVPPPRKYHKAFPLDEQFSKGWNECRAAMLAAAPEAPAQGGRVSIPTSEDEAAAMAIMGSNWLQEHAPHRLKQTTEAQAIPAPWREAVKVARGTAQELIAAERAYKEAQGGPWVRKNVPHAVHQRLYLAWQAHHAALAQLDALEGGE